MSLNKYIYIYFNKQGVITTQIPHGSGIIRQGDTFDIYVLFDKDVDFSNKALYIKFKIPGLPEWTPDYSLTDNWSIQKFKKIKSNEITYDLKDGVDYLTYVFHVNTDLQVTEKFGNLDALITIMDKTTIPISEITSNSYEEVENVFMNGLITIYIEKTYGKTFNTNISHDQYNTLLSIIGSNYSQLIEKTEADDLEFRKEIEDVIDHIDSFGKFLYPSEENKHFSSLDQAFEIVFDVFYNPELELRTCSMASVSVDVGGSYKKYIFVKTSQNNIVLMLDILNEMWYRFARVGNKSPYSYESTPLFSTPNELEDLFKLLQDNVNELKTNINNLDVKINSKYQESINHTNAKIDLLDASLVERYTDADENLKKELNNEIDLKQNKKLDTIITYKSDTKWDSVEDALQGITKILKDFFLGENDSDNLVENLNEIRHELNELSSSLNNIIINSGIPKATKNTLGAVIIGDNINVNDGVISIDEIKDSSVGYTGSYAEQYGTNVQDVLDKIISDINYVKIAINSFSANYGIVELGTTIKEIKFNFTFNKKPKTVTLDGTSIANNITSYTLSNLTLTSSKTFTLKATDDRNASASRNVAITFLNGVYYGTSDVISENTKKLSNGNLSSFTVNAGDGQYIYYAIPARFATPNFWVGGFEGGFNLDRTEDYTNSSGYTESYNVYKSTNAGLGSTKVEVK